jgi:WW domain-containing oxidoreductase
MTRKSDTPKKSTFGAKSTAEDVTDGIDLMGKTAFITGVNSGLGFETMRVLSMRGAHVIGAARTLEKAQEACAQIDGPTTPVACELSNLSSVKQCVASIKDAGPIDMLICNAGIMALPKLEQSNGLELQFATNHLGHFLLVSGLIEQVTNAPAGRVVMLSSAGHHFAPKEGIQFDNLSGEESYSGWRAYGQSKLANVLFANELNRRLAGTKATANSLHPGGIRTNLGRHLGIGATIGFTTIGAVTGLLSLFGIQSFKSVPQGAATTCYVATSPNLDGFGGFYFSDCNVAKTSNHGRDDSLAKKLWEVSEELAADFL